MESAMKRFDGTITLITGASSGIGAALGREIAGRGGDVVLTARRKDRLHDLAREVKAVGQRALAIQADVANDGDIELAVKKTVGEWGRIDYVVANAGFGVAGRFENLSIEDFRRQFETNVFGVLRTLYATRESLIASRGCLCIIGSVNGYLATSNLSPYVMSKFAVHGFAASLRDELNPCGVGVVLIVPGAVRTEIRQVDKMGIYHPEARDRVPAWMMIKPEEAATQIADAMYKRKSIEVISGHGKLLVFFQRHCPELLYAVLHFFKKKGLF